MELESLIGLAGAIAGASIVLTGQFLTRRIDRRDKRSDLLLESCVELIAIQEEFRGRLWNEWRASATGQVDGWNAEGFRRAEARIGILSQDAGLRGALRDLRNAGKDLGAQWRLDPTDEQAVERCSQVHRQALDGFISASRQTRPV